VSDSSDTSASTGSDVDPAGPATAVVVFWRPGCSFCASLLYQLEETDLPVALVNIWEDERGAATVRSIANGNETVPTVVVGEVGLVNPSMRQLMATVEEHAPHLLDAGAD